MMTFLVGDRVLVKREITQNFKQPWRSRFDAGCVGTVVANFDGGRIKVEFDSKRKKKRQADWILNLYQKDVEAAE